MALRFIFAPQEEVDTGNLQQGDILQKTDTLKEAISQAHQYYANAGDYHFFMVLTQSCDLVRRKGKPKTPYISIAAMRPARILINRVIERHAFQTEGFPVVLCPKEREIIVRQFLERLLNNTEESLFFVRRDSHPALAEDYCVFLPLSIALRAEHYQGCLAAKVAQLKDVFQAKIGWLTSNMYGRVGTPDISDWLSDPEAYKKEFYEEVLYRRTVWLSRAQHERFVPEASERECSTEEEAREILNAIEDDVELAANEIAELLSRKQVLAGDDREETVRKVANVLTNARVFRRLVTQAAGR